MDQFGLPSVAGIRADDLRPLQPTPSSSRMITGTPRWLVAVSPDILQPSFRNWDHPSAGRYSAGAPGLGCLMCRHLGWLGAPTPISALLLDPPRTAFWCSPIHLVVRSTVCSTPTGGVGFFAGGQARRWRCRTLWGMSFASVAPAPTSGCVVARSGRPRSACPSSQRVRPVHRRSVVVVAQRRCRPISTAAGADAESVVDSAVLAALIFARGLDHLGRTIIEVGEADPNARLNILAANGSRLLATTWGHAVGIAPARRVAVASEPYDDDPDWQDGPTGTWFRSPAFGRNADNVTLTRWGGTCDPGRTPGCRLPQRSRLRNDVRGLTARTPKSLPPKWFYDATGGDLFDRITRLPEVLSDAPGRPSAAGRASRPPVRTRWSSSAAAPSEDPDAAGRLCALSRNPAPFRSSTSTPAFWSLTGDSLQQRYPGCPSRRCAALRASSGQIRAVERLFVFPRLHHREPDPTARHSSPRAQTGTPRRRPAAGHRPGQDTDRLVRAYDDSAA